MACISLLSIMTSGFIHVVACDSILFLFVVEKYPLYLVYTTFCLPIYPSMDIWVAFTSWLLWVMLLWIGACECLSQTLLWIFLVINSEVRLLDHISVLFLIFWGNSILYFKAVAPFYNPTNSAQGVQFSISLPTLDILFF